MARVANIRIARSIGLAPWIRNLFALALLHLTPRPGVTLLLPGLRLYS
jgi:hypothetical protein